MSRIGKKPVAIPAGVTVTKDASRQLVVKGPKGELKLGLRPEIDVAVEGGNVQVKMVGEGGARTARAYFGMTRAMIQNMVVGVTKGFEKKLEIQGVGWNAAMQGQKISLNIGYNKPVVIDIPKGLTVLTPDPANVIITGADKQAVGHMAATIRKRRPPEPYKGKGIRYKDEVVRRKAGKSFGS
ncbi:MAG: 50S ribosomal protein L6 [Planctomycetota bacterium]|nr:50S ribosomal protein L6 [Planctomycetota bacterium]